MNKNIIKKNTYLLLNYEDHAETVKGYGDFQNETEYILHYDVTYGVQEVEQNGLYEKCHP